MSELKLKKTKFACYAACFSMSSVFSFPALLFITFREMYGISYTLLGTLILINFCTQLSVDLIFTLFSKKFNIKTILRIMPLLTATGLLVYALIPTFLPNFAYIGLASGTVIFSIGAGFSEVLLSPTVAAIPSKNPQRDMSVLHSLYAFGVFTVAIITTAYIKIFKAENWAYLALFFAALPVISSILFITSPMPEMNGSGNTEVVVKSKERIIGMALCVACIFFGACAETVMSNWVSSYVESALRIDKLIGDLLGLAGFAVLLGLSRVGYAKFGKNISAVLLVGMIGSAVCYWIAGFSSHAVPALIACMLTGLFTGMLWPGTLILLEEKIPSPSVAAYALMAAGGDLGASFAPQLMGVVVDSVATSGFAVELSAKVGLSAEQIGMKAGILVSSIFPVLGISVVLVIINYFKKHSLSKPKNLLSVIEMHV